MLVCPLQTSSAGLSFVPVGQGVVEVRIAADGGWSPRVAAAHPVQVAEAFKRRLWFSPGVRGCAGSSGCLRDAVWLVATVWFDFSGRSLRSVNTVPTFSQGARGLGNWKDVCKPSSWAGMKTQVSLHPYQCSFIAAYCLKSLKYLTMMI